MLPARNKQAILPCLFGVTIIVSLAIGFWTYLIDPIINKDGIRYVLASKAFLQGNFALGLDTYKWPFYSLTVACVAWIIGMPVEASALLFNALMRGLGGIAFLLIVKRLGGDYRQILLAMLVYLFYPGLNELQSMIIRDIAFLACFLWMVVFFVDTLRKPTPARFTLFVVSGLLAMAYRIEGIVYLAGLLLYYLFHGNENLLSRKVRSVFVLAAAAIVINAGLIWFVDGEITRMWQVIVNNFNRNTVDFDGYTTQMEPGFWKSALIGLKFPILFLTPTANLFLSIIEVISIGYVILLISGWFLRPVLNNSTPRVSMYHSWRWIIVLNLALLVAYSNVKHIFTDRYPLSLAVMLILLIPFILTRIHETTLGLSRARRTTILTLTSGLMILNTAEGLDSFSSKQYLREAGNWIFVESGGQYNARLYANDVTLHYYAGTPKLRGKRYYNINSVSKFIENDRWRELDFLAIKMEESESFEMMQDFQNRTGHVPKRIFKNEKGFRVQVYDFRPSEQDAIKK